MNLKAKLLLVDDDPILIKGLTHHLKAHGYDVTVASDGTQAVAAARRQHPDLIVLDIGLPGGDGYTVLQRLKQMDPMRHIPVIVLSAWDPATNRDKSLAAGAELFLEKPADFGALLATIQRYLGEAAA